MCDCPKDKINELISRRGDTDDNSLQGENCEHVDRRSKQGCCRRVLTYEDEVTVTELPVCIPTPPRCTELAGVAIVRRRIDYCPSPDARDEPPKKADEGTTSEPTSEPLSEPISEPTDDDKEKPKDPVQHEEEKESPVDRPPENVIEENQRVLPESIPTSTPSPNPGQPNPGPNPKPKCKCKNKAKPKT